MRHFMCTLHSNAHCRWNRWCIVISRRSIFPPIQSLAFDCYSSNSIHIRIRHIRFDFVGNWFIEVNGFSIPTSFPIVCIHVCRLIKQFRAVYSMFNRICCNKVCMVWFFFFLRSHFTCDNNNNKHAFDLFLIKMYMHYACTYLIAKPQTMQNNNKKLCEKLCAFVFGYETLKIAIRIKWAINILV